MRTITKTIELNLSEETANKFGIVAEPITWQDDNSITFYVDAEYQVSPAELYAPEESEFVGFGNEDYNDELNEVLDFDANNLERLENFIIDELEA